MNTFSTFKITRRQTLAGLGATTALAGLGACKTLSAVQPANLAPDELLDTIAYGILEHEPERATSLGVDTGDYAHLRSQLKDQSRSGQTHYRASLQQWLGQVQSYPKSLLNPVQRTSFEVVESAFSTALDGFAMPYGDVAVGGWRNAPYVVIQNVGSYLDLPRFFESPSQCAIAQMPMPISPDWKQCPAHWQVNWNGCNLQPELAWSRLIS